MVFKKNGLDLDMAGIGLEKLGGLGLVTYVVLLHQYHWQQLSSYYQLLGQLVI